jgi:hypothetical protein
MSDPMDDLAAKIARMLAQTDGQPRVMPHNQDDARAVLDVIKEAGFAIVATRTYEPERLIDDLRANANRQHERICELVRERDEARVENEQLRDVLDRLSDLTPNAANAETPRDLYLHVKAIVETALAKELTE